MRSQSNHSFKVFSFRYRIATPHGSQNKKGQSEDSYLLKYYPKYYNKIHLEKIDASIAVKVKGLKRLYHFTVNLNNNQRNDLTSIWLQKVRKDLRSIVKIFRDGEYDEGEAVKWYGGGFKDVKWCTGIERIEIPGYFLRDPFQSPNETLKNSKEEVNRILRYLAHAKRVKKIDLSISQQMSEFLVKRLSGLKKLREKIGDTKARIFCFESLNVPGLKTKSSMIAKHLGHLTIDKVEGENLKEFGEILGALDGLQSLRISLIKSAKVYETPLSELQEMSLSLFAAIKGLPRLERLFMKFSGGGVLGLMSHFAIPKSLKQLTLSLSAGNNIFAALACQEGGLQEATVLRSFYSVIQKLPCLESLQLILSPLLYDDPKNVLDFVVLLLRGIPKLSQLKLDLPSFPVEYYNKGYVLDFSCLFEAIQHLQTGLEELIITFPGFLRPVVWSFGSQNDFLKLREMSISGNISPNLDLRQALISLMGDSSPESKKRKFEIRQIVVNCQEELEGLLANIQGIGDSEMELNAEVKLHINIKEKDDEGVVKSLIQFIKGMRYMQGLGMSIEMCSNEKVWDLLETVKEQNVFDYIEIKMAPGEFCYVSKKEN